ncbi:hypothetical protein DKAM_0313 [Desulfurococcus amylolyticus 1221n]|uniref:Uncharacterized protein n=1 Tax=Desulfurococcus amylolyticus (strain DSM 18924 / JCM 16383 / VKM B-2413 / 1221n) TaxID=490899 RepID=B8D3F8_DESA1|nr:hypothetical protein DKAM_0313 [Desulfurococcus amylolyticus 1221n]
MNIDAHIFLANTISERLRVFYAYFYPSTVLYLNQTTGNVTVSQGSTPGLRLVGWSGYTVTLSLPGVTVDNLYVPFDDMVLNITVPAATSVMISVDPVKRVALVQNYSPPPSLHHVRCGDSARGASTARRSPERGAGPEGLAHTAVVLHHLRGAGRRHVHADEEAELRALRPRRRGATLRGRDLGQDGRRGRHACSDGRPRGLAHARMSPAYSFINDIESNM